MGVERDVADLVADQQRNSFEAFELVVEAALALRVGEQRDPLGRGPKQDALAGETGPDSERYREVRFAGPWGSESTTFSRAWRKSSWPRCSITCFLTERWKVKELLERLAGGEPGGADAALTAVRVAARLFG